MAQLPAKNGQNVENHPMPKMKDERVTVNKGALITAFEKAAGSDWDEFKNDAKEMARRRIWSFIGDLLIDYAGKIFHNPRRNAQQNGTVVRTYDAGGYVNYGNPGSVPAAAAKKDRFEFTDLVWAQRSSATHLLDILTNAIATNGYVTVSELYDILDDTSHLDPNDNFYGWTDLSGAYVGETYGNFRLYLPRPVSLK